jgi:CheY-like chemotaxis protein
LRLNIVDDGPGIPEDKLRSLFKPFDRLGVETSAIQGVGLGLTISRSLAVMMSCRLGLLEKKDPGRHFYLDIPVSSTPISTVASQLEIVPCQAEVTDISLQPKVLFRILYIEDNELDRLLLVSIIEKRPDIELLVATGGRQGISMSLKEHPDLILVNINLPDMDGFAVLRELKSHHLTCKTPLVALSKSDTPEERENLRAAGFAEHIAKPVHIGIFFAVLDRLRTKKQKT